MDADLPQRTPDPNNVARFHMHIDPRQTCEKCAPTSGHNPAVTGHTEPMHSDAPRLSRAKDRCDRCPAAALTRFALESQMADLIFCGHHSDMYEPGLLAQGFTLVIDERPERKPVDQHQKLEPV